MIVSYSITKDQKPTPEQIAEIREAAKRPIVFDEDCLANFFNAKIWGNLISSLSNPVSSHKETNTSSSIGICSGCIFLLIATSHTEAML